MKKILFLAIIALVLVGGIGYYAWKKTHVSTTPVLSGVTDKDWTVFVGLAQAQFEGLNILRYTIPTPKGAKIVPGIGNNINLTKDDKALAHIFMSYEGGRGYSPQDYVVNVVKVKDKSVSLMREITLASTTWIFAQNDTHEWYISVAGKNPSQWLAVIDGAQKDHDMLVYMATSFQSH